MQGHRGAEGGRPAHFIVLTVEADGAAGVEVRFTAEWGATGEIRVRFPLDGGRAEELVAVLRSDLADAEVGGERQVWVVRHGGRSIECGATPVEYDAEQTDIRRVPRVQPGLSRDGGLEPELDVQLLALRERFRRYWRQ